MLEPGEGAMPGIPALGRMRQEDGKLQANLRCAVRKTKAGSGAGRVHFRIPLALLQPGCCGLWGTNPVSGHQCPGTCGGEGLGSLLPAQLRCCESQPPSARSGRQLVSGDTGQLFVLTGAAHLISKDRL